MAWLLKDTRGPAWKQEWTRRTLASMSLPPFPLVAIFFIIILLLSVSSFMSYKNRMQHTLINLKLLLLFLPVLLIFLAMFASKVETFMFPNTKAQYGSADNRNWNLPWGLAVLVVVLLVMITKCWNPVPEFQYRIMFESFQQVTGEGWGAAAKEWPSKSSNAT